MKYIISGSNRPNGNSIKVAQYIQGMYQKLGEQTEIIDLAAIDWTKLNPSYDPKQHDPEISTIVDKLNQSEAMHFVVPEYNGSMPGILKLFIDHWHYPSTFEYRPVCFVGLGGLFGGLRPVEHMQQILGYRNAFIYPDRIFLMNIWKILQDGKITDKLLNELLEQQVQGFCTFATALKGAELDANHHIAKKAAAENNS